MMKSIKKHISVLLALSIIISALSCIFSVGVSAAEEQDMSSAAYLLQFNNTATDAGRCISSDPHSMNGKPVSISFKYCLKNAESGKLSVENVVGGYFTDSTTKSKWLLNGEHSFSYTSDSYEKEGVCVAIKNMSGSNITAELYIWDVEIKADGKDIFNIAAKQWCISENTAYEIVTYEDVVNAKPAYLISYNNVPDGGRYTFSKDRWGAAGKPVKISFKYNLKNAEDKKLYFTNVAGSGDFNDDTTGDRYLYAGEHSYSYTTDNYLRDGFCFAAAVTGTATLNAQLYIWDVVIELDGEDLFTGATLSQYTDKNCSISEITYEDALNSKTAHKISFKGKPVGSRWFSIVTDTHGTSVNVSFKYSLVNASNGELAIKGIGTGLELPDATTGNGRLVPGVHSYSYSTDNYNIDSSTCIAVAVTDENKDKASNAELYIWDVDITVNGVNQFNVNSFQMSGDALVRKPDYSEVTYGEVVSTQNVYEFSFVGKTSGVTRWRTFGKDVWFNNNSVKVKISFDYYLTGAEDGELFVYNPATANTAYKDKNTGDGLLRAGKHKFVFEDDSYTGYIGAAIAVSDISKECNAKIYMWNIEVIADGKSHFGTNGYKINDEARIPDMAIKSYNDMPCKGDANNDGIVDIRDLIRVKSHLSMGTYLNRSNVNLNGDITIDSADLAFVRKILLSL